MKTIPKKQLEKLVKGGWVVENISKLDTSKEEGLKALSDIFDRFLADNEKTLSAMNNIISDFIEHQKTENSKKLPPPPIPVKIKEGKPKKWRFDVARNGQGFIKTITAVEI